ncbi:MAG: hypothetical protein QGG09_22285 [Pirellulaceae bacterium]|nr:hypothetical protein [Pirellulaceae bacterium]
MAQQPDLEAKVLFPGYEKLGRMVQLRDAIESRLSDTQVATQLRQAAVDIVELPDELVASFTASNVDERHAQLMKKVSKIHTGMEPVFEWIERRGTHETAKSLRTQFMWIFAEVLGCAECDIPEYEGGVAKPFHIGDPSNGWQRASCLNPRIVRLASSLIARAHDIESDLRTREPECTSPPTSRKASKSGPKATVNLRMYGVLQENPEAMGWSCLKWAKCLKCARSTVVATAAWKTYKDIREKEKAERALDRRRG